jgi:hypothetical protein
VVRRRENMARIKNRLYVAAVVAGFGAAVVALGAPLKWY